MIVQSKGTKHDGQKADFSLFSWIWLVGVARVLTRGKVKYAAHNWRKGIEVSRLMAAVLRHITLFMAGIDYDFDPECEGCKAGNCTKHTGEHHLDCASCSLMFAREMLVTRPDLDDRFKLSLADQIKLIKAIENEERRENEQR